jgi:hypothetical protein
MMYQHLSPDYQEQVMARWSDVLKAGGEINNTNTALATALVLENTQREFQKSQRRLSESYAGSLGGMGAGANAPLPGGALGTDHDFIAGQGGGVPDSRIPTIVIPTLRRIFPELLAHSLVGVQPMNGPVGFAFALRAQYNVNRQGLAGDTSAAGQEIGYNTINSDFTGASGLTDLDRSGLYSGTPNPAAPNGHFDVGTTLAGGADATFWNAFAGSYNGTIGNAQGTGAGMEAAEWWKVGEDMPMSKFVMEKGVVEAKTRKLGAHWSLELGEDMMNMHGVDVDSEMVNIMSYEVQAEIDRQLLGEMVKAALGGTAGQQYSTWSPVSADGRNQLERIGTIYTQLLIGAQRIATNTRRGPANFAVADSTTTALLERLSDFTLDAASVQANNDSVGIAHVGTMRQGSIKLYRDTFAGGNYILLGYKGPTAYDSGIIYCPYIPIQLMKATGEQDFSPRMGLRTRYGVLNHLFGSANYYHFIKVDGLTDSVLAADGGRVFTY